MHRSNAQNKSYQEWIQATADECNEKGIDLTVLFTDPADVPVTKDTLHRGMTHKLTKARFGKTSTADLTTSEMTTVIEDLRRIIAERSHGEVNIPFPVKSNDKEQ